MTTFDNALAPFLADGSLTHYYPLNARHQGRDIVGGLDAANYGGVTITNAGAHFNGGNYLAISDHPDFSAASTGELTVLAFVTITDWRGGAGTNSSRLNVLAKGARGNYEWAFRQYRSGHERQGWLTFYHWNLSGGYGAASKVLVGPDEPTRELVIGGQVSSGLTAWLDGQQVDADPLDGYVLESNGTVVTVTPGDGTAPVTVGTRADGEGYLIGRVRRLMFFNRALAPDEHAAIWDARDLPDAPPPPTIEQRVADIEARVAALEAA